MNSYKRFVDESWAPTRYSAWSYDNRTAGFRLVGHDQSLRIECRIRGADCNPYLALAALAACGRAGIEQQIDPPPPFVGDAYRAEVAAHAPALAARRHRCLRGQLDGPPRHSGPGVVTHYVHALRTEQAAFDAAVTDWERQRYFERI